jgi:hypothetical protein
MAGLMLNEDDSHFFGSRTVDKMTVEGLKELVDHYLCPQMKTLLFNPNCQRTSYDSRAWTPIWKGYDPDGPNDQPYFPKDTCLTVTDEFFIRRWPHNSLMLHKKGIDPFAVWLDYTRSKGVAAWLTMRMNDVHDAQNEESYLHSEFWKKHKELRRVGYRPMVSWADAAFDYRHQAVRDYHLSLIDEFIQRWDFDGLELDWMRFGHHIAPGHEAEGRECLIQFMGEVRKRIDQAIHARNHPIKLSVRVPSRPDVAREMGMDAVTWARMGLIDLIVITPFWESMEFDMPIELWKDVLRDTDVELAAGLELNIRPFGTWSDGHFFNTAETVRGAAASFLDRGADRIYLFNYMDSQTSVDSPQDQAEILRDAGELATAIAHPRRHISTYADVWPVGAMLRPILPQKAEDYAAIRIPIGPKPKTGSAWVWLGFDQETTDSAAGLDVFVNGRMCHATTIAPPPMHPVVKKSFGYEIDLAALNRGYNVIEVRRKNKDDRYTIQWAEIRIAP